jgi:nitrite reductase/ring-hydroxylating ferredoxin subunit
MPSLSSFVRVAPVEAFEEGRAIVVHGIDRPIAVFAHDGRFAAVDNRCPHLGFPMSRARFRTES